MATAHINKLPQIARTPEAQAIAMPSKAIEPNDLNEVMTFAQVAVRSGTFGLKNIEEAAFRILYGRELGMSVFQSIMGIDIIQGRPGLKAGTVASLIQRSGRYEYRVGDWDHLKCVIEFFDGGQVLGKSTFTIEDAKRAQVYKEGSNWSKYPKAMLFARAITQGARAYCPSIFFGPVYSSEELADGVEYVDAQIVETPPEVQPEPEVKATKKPSKKAEPAPEPEPVAEQPADDPPFDDEPAVETVADKVKKLDAWAERVAKRFEDKGQAAFAHPGKVIEEIHAKFVACGLVPPGASSYRDRTKAIAGVEEPWAIILDNLKAFAAELNAELEQPPAEPGSEG
jgi:hypothetical protein